MRIDFEIVHISRVSKLLPRPEYVLVIEDFYKNLASRIALKYFPSFKTINISKHDSEAIYDAFMSHLTELKEVYESLIDEESKKTFYGFWLGRITNIFSYLHHSNCVHYLLTGFIPKAGGIVIQAGTYDGGTAKVFSEMGYKVYSFEMNKENFALSKQVAAENNFILENLGLGSAKGELRYTGMHINQNGSEIAEITTLDAYVRENNLPSVDFIELDVEGAEMDILKGAVVTIARFKPILAISAYHKYDDFWTIMNFIKSIRPDYEFALQHGILRPETEPMTFKNYESDYCIPGLIDEMERRNFDECVLFAR